MGKSKCFTLPSTNVFAVNFLDLIFMDVWGAAPVVSTRGFSYFLLLVDSYSRYMLDLTNKFDVLPSFITFQKLVENQFTCKIKRIQKTHCPVHINKGINVKIHFFLIH